MVEENTNVTLNCSTSNTTGVRVTWFKDDKSLSAGADLSDGDRILTLTRVTKSNTGLYRCTASNFVSSAESNLVNITVAYGPVIQLNPEGTVEKSLNSDLKLECTADSVPGALFQWFFNNTKQEATGNSFQVQLSNWANEGNYTCQATNPFTHRNATKTVYVKLIEGSPDPGLSPGAIAGIVIGCLAGVGLVAGLLYFICTKTSLGRTERQASNGNVPSAPGHNEGVTDTKPKAAEEDLQYSILAFKDSNRSPPRPGSEAPPPSDGVTIYSEIKKK
ncbi:hypothetical protein lerEdw1_009926 [Lerista edwardsae]|nr:hypothetical protein lerEdw1_009926 [Lerista edwardsae]